MTQLFLTESGESKLVREEKEKIKKKRTRRKWLLAKWPEGRGPSHHQVEEKKWAEKKIEGALAMAGLGGISSSMLPLLLLLLLPDGGTALLPLGSGRCAGPRHAAPHSPRAGAGPLARWAAVALRVA